MNASSPPIAPAMPANRLFEWSVRREFWENRSLYIAPLSVAALVLFGSAIGMISLPRRRQAVLMLDPARQQAALERPYDQVVMVILLTAFVVGVFYCLDALHGERRDRSILFWKSLPVSDTTTVLAKASIPLLFLPLLSFAIIFAIQLLLFLMSSAVLAGSGMGDSPRYIPSPLGLLSFLIITALWHAPLYGWMLLVSSWARRAVFLWAFLPTIVIGIFERMAFRTSYFGSLLRERIIGTFQGAFVREIRQGRPHVSMGPLTQLDPGEFLTRPGLWIGLAIAAGFLALAVWQRRYREPI